MSILRSLHATRHTRRISDVIFSNSCYPTRTNFPSICQKESRLRASTNSRLTKMNVFKKRSNWTIPIGIGLTLLGILQWKSFHSHTHSTKDRNKTGPISTFMVECYCCLPLRITSRLWGWIANIEIPTALRPTIYKSYAKVFGVNLNEIDLDLETFSSLVDFFVRPLKDGARPVATNVNVVSPADGKVLHFGPVTSCQVEQVKGVTYNLRHFLGKPDWPEIADGTAKVDDIDDCGYLNLLLKNPANRLYQLIVYLAPGDYHRFHSPTNWQLHFRRHFQGKLLSVNPKIAGWVPNLFALNERVVYVGEWMEGFMAYTAVGATNVGSIRVYCDEKLVTNTKKWPPGKNCDDARLGCTNMSKGQMLGEFRMGSTIVLLFEAPPDFQFSLQPGQSIKMGQALSSPKDTSKQRSHA